MWIKNWFNELENGLDKIAQIKPIYIYKDNEGLKKYKGIVEWKKDPNGTVEHHFFKHHYPCLSFTVISNTGNYISFFSEFAKEHVWQLTREMYK